MNKKLFCKTFVIIFSLILVACKGADKEAEIQNTTSIKNNITIEPVKPVSACTKLTLETLKEVFPEKTFEIETNRNDEPNIYEALSSCRYKESGKEVAEQYYVDLEIRAQQSKSEAARFFNNKKEMDYDKKGKSVSGYGDDAYLTVVSMAYGGPHIEFIKDNVYYKLNIQSIKSGVHSTLEETLLKIAKKIAS